LRALMLLTPGIAERNIGGAGDAARVCIALAPVALNTQEGAFG
jgi:hypothetical protein